MDLDTTRRLLELARSGDDRAESQLYEHIQDDLRQRAHYLMRQQGPGHTLQTTAVVHEAWMRVVGPDASISDRSHFLRLATRAMRSILIDHARARRAEKRGGGRDRVPIDDIDAGLELSFENHEFLLEIDDLLDQLGTVDPQCSNVAELRLFGGLEHSEVAAVLGVSTRTVERAWRAGNAWLRRELASGA